MKGIILAAGRGSRMGGLTDERPKCMAELAGRPLIAWQLEALSEAGVEPVAVVRGYRGERIVAPEATWFDNPRWNETNMVLSLACAEPWLTNATCLVSYADLVYGPEAVRALARCPGDIVIAYDTAWLELWQARFEDPLSDAETFQLHPDGRLRSIGARTTSLADIEGQYMGLLKFTPAGWGTVRTYLEGLSSEERDRLDMTGMLSRLLERGVTIQTCPVTGGWGEVDDGQDLALYQGWLDAGRNFLRPPAPE